jgi:hypothetical protein
MNYTSLIGAVTDVGSIKYWINYTRIDSTGILAEAEAWIYARMRLQQMLATSDVEIAAAATTANLPAGYLDPVHFGIPDHQPTIKFQDPQRFRSRLGWDQNAMLPESLPTLWTNIGGVIQLNTKADQAYAAKMAHYKTPAPLGADNLTNWLTDRYPTLVRRVCLMFAAEARKEFDSMDRAEIKAIEMVDQIKVENDLAMRGMELDFNWEGSN